MEPYPADRVLYGSRRRGHARRMYETALRTGDCCACGHGGRRVGHIHDVPGMHRPHSREQQLRVEGGHRVCRRPSERRSSKASRRRCAPGRGAGGSSRRLGVRAPLWRRAPWRPARRRPAQTRVPRPHVACDRAKPPGYPGSGRDRPRSPRPEVRRGRDAAVRAVLRSGREQSQPVGLSTFLTRGAGRPTRRPHHRVARRQPAWNPAPSTVGWSVGDDSRWKRAHRYRHPVCRSRQMGS